MWSEIPALHLPRLRGELSADLCVVGLGASGLAAVSAALDRGLDVVGLDASAPGAGASGRNGGFWLAGAAAFHHRAAAALGRRRATAVYRLTLEEMDQALADTPQAYGRTGSLRIAASEDERDDCAAQLAAMRRDGLPVEPYEGPEGRGLLFPADGVLQPQLRCNVAAERVLAGGARLFGSTPATGIDVDGVTTPAGRVGARRTVVAVDGGLELLLGELGGRVRSARAQMLATAPTAETALTRPVYARWGYDYWQQLADGRIVLGGFRDAGGDAEWTTSTEPTPAVQQRLQAFLRAGLGVRAPVRQRWAGCIGFTPDGLPIVNEIRPGVVAAGGYSGTGNVIGPLCGRAAVELALDGTSRLAGVLSSDG